MASLEYHPLIASDEIGTVRDTEVIASGQILSRGMVLGKRTSNKKLYPVDSSKSDGTEHPYGILYVDVDSTEGDVHEVVFKTGVFIRSALSFGGSDTIDTHKDALRQLNIHTELSIDKDGKLG